MLVPHKGHESHEAGVSTSITEASESTTELPCLIDPPAAEQAIDDAAVSPPADQFSLRPLSETILEHESELVLPSDGDTIEIAASPLLALAPLLQRAEPLTWVFAGVRLTGDASFGDGRLPGEWFAEEWRAESGRVTDLVIDATWPECSVTTLKSHLRTRVVRHRPDVAVLFLDRSDSASGVENLPQFERRLVGVLSVLAEIGAATVLVQPAMEDDETEIDAEVYFEAILGIAKERGLVHLVLPKPAASASRVKTPDSEARHAGLFICREAMRAS